ncbi:hypothetical protein CHARACLAT_012045 [Characodon lateralis]|uniref:Uncharacterized protein n=1 Tax=Characodon lateralis TaxID=208331 RepID=A0ABU7F4U5_9TELE|nr:hypothetical protein [Characodon lateralis]
MRDRCKEDRSADEGGGLGGPTRNSQAHLHAQCGLWKPPPREGLDSLLLWSGPRGKGGGLGLLVVPQLSRLVLGFTPVDERVASLRLQRPRTSTPTWKVTVTRGEA